MRVRDSLWNPPLRTLRLSDDIPFCSGLRDHSLAFWRHATGAVRSALRPVKYYERTSCFLRRDYAPLPSPGWHTFLTESLCLRCIIPVEADVP